MALSTPRPLRERIVGILPLLCLIHCVGTAIVAVAMPAAALWMRNEWLEGGLTALSAILIGSLVLRRRPAGDGDDVSDPINPSVALYIAAVVLAAIGWLYDADWLRHGSLLLLVATQLVWLRARGRRPLQTCECAHDAGPAAVVLAPARD